MNQTTVNRPASPDVSSTTFWNTFRNLSAARVAHEDAGRNPEGLRHLAQSHLRLNEARCDMRLQLSN